MSVDYTARMVRGWKFTYDDIARLNPTIADKEDGSMSDDFLEDDYVHRDDYYWGCLSDNFFYLGSILYSDGDVVPDEDDYTALDEQLLAFFKEWFPAVTDIPPIRNYIYTEVW